jgi:hypothetical protein
MIHFHMDGRVSGGSSHRSQGPVLFVFLKNLLITFKFQELTITTSKWAEHEVPLASLTDTASKSGVWVSNLTMAIGCKMSALLL